jgi:3-dehydroquinate dehydratase I
MTTRRTGKVARPQLVGVIASQTDLRHAVATRPLPDFFELRLDALSPISSLDEKNISRLRAPLIITARDPREGGVGNLPVEKRRELLLRFLARAEYIDVELKSIREFNSLLGEAKKRKVRLILSYHNFKATPSSRSLCAMAKRAKILRADIFKVATHTDTPGDVAQLVDFVTNNRVALPISAMGIGKLGAISRLLLARCGSVLNYAALGQANVEGQLPLEVLRSSVGGNRC